MKASTGDSSDQCTIRVRTMAPAYLNYTVLGHEAFEVLPYYVPDNHDSVATVLEGVCSVWEVPHLQQRSYFWLLKDPIPFDKVSSNSWLLDSSTNMHHHATRVFKAQNLADVWTNRDPNCLHAVLCVPVADRSEATITHILRYIKPFMENLRKMMESADWYLSRR